MDKGRVLAIAAGILAGAATMVPLTMRSGVDAEAVSKVLEDDPTILMKALERLGQEQQKAARDESAKTALPVVREILKGDSRIPAIGRAGAAEVVEFFDYNCGYCKVFGEKTADPLVAEGRIRLHLVQAPILGEGSRVMAEYAAASQIQGRFAEAHSFLLKQKAPDAAAAEALRPRLIEAAGLDGTRFDAALSDGSAKSLVDHSMSLAEKAQLRGTPLIYAGGEIHAGAIDRATMEALISK